MEDRFASYHPVINFTFFIGAVVFGVLLMHPAFLVCSLALSMVYYVTVRGRTGLSFVSGMAGLFLALTALNPLFNTNGETVLFTYFGGRPYTLEALLYGVALSAMMVSVLTWFASYNEVMTSDKFLYLFGKMAPSASMVLTMVLRLVPAYKKKAVQMNGARNCIGMGTGSGSKMEKAKHGMVLLSALTSWALEGGIIEADSMRSRGYGCGQRTAFSLYRFEGRDRLMLGVMIFLLAVVAIGCFQGGAAASYTPHLEIPGRENCWTVSGLAAYIIFLSIPSAVNIWEEARWRSLKSKI